MFPTIIFVMLISVFQAYAADIYANELDCLTGNDISIPILIKNNGGLMGFKITVEYPNDILTSPEVTRGNITSNGIFNDSITDSTAGSFDVIWNNTSNINGEGTLMILKFKVSDDTPTEKCKIKLFYSQEDTFNENWEDVALDIEDIYINISNDVSISHTSENDDKIAQIDSEITTTAISSDETTNYNVDADTILNDISENIDSGYIKDSIEDAITESGADDIGSMSQEQFEDFKSQIEKDFSDYGLNIDFSAISKEGCEKLYESAITESFVNDVTQNINDDEIKYIIDETLNEYGADDFSKVKESDRKKLSENVISKLKEKAPEINTDKIEEKKICFEAVEKLCSQIFGDKDALNGNEKRTVFYIAFVLFLFMVIAVAIALIYKNKKSKNTEVKP